MRKIFTLLLLVAGYSVAAQQYNNEWINYDQPYYKFKVGRTGVFRIPKTTLDAIGIGGTQVENFELWRNGKKVPFYSSVANGQLPSDGYLEFWGQINDGKPDKDLYRDVAFQHTDVTSLITDTASYFLSINTNQSGFRYVTVTNDVAGNTRPLEPYFMHTVGIYNKIKVNLGFAAVVGEYVYSSSYDKGEFNSSSDILPASPLSQNLLQMNAHAGGPDATLRFGAVGNALNPRTIKVRVNGSDVIDTLMDYFNDVHTSVPISSAMLAPSTFTIQFNNTSLISTDRMAVSYFDITYARNFVFNGQTNFEFKLPAKPEGYYLQITSFNTGGTPPVLYDMASGERFVGDIGAPGMVRFALPGTAVDRNLVLCNNTVANSNAITSLTPRFFTRFNVPANQGNFILISHAILHTGTSGNDPVLDYKNYRQSAAGGGYTVLVADIEELIDQFAFGIKKNPLSIRNFLRYARTNFAVPPKFALMLGKGMTYIDYKRNQHQADAERLNLVPTFGYPGSDNMLGTDDITNPIAATPLGRLSAINGKEVEDYLEKLKEYELIQKTAPNTIADRAWMKNVVHVTGSSDPYLGTVLCHYMDVYRQIIQDTAYGAVVSNFCKTSTNPVEQISSGRLEGLFAEGISFLTYFGHSSSTTLEFNIDNPQNYNNPGKYPLFFVNGCNAGNFFTYNVQRLVANETLSEKFVLAKQRGSIAFVASTHYGIVNYLNLYLTNLYNTISYTDYGKSIGEIQRIALQKMVTATGPYDFYARAHAEEITLHGDPAISINGQPKPDYVIEESSIRITPTFISTAAGEFTVRARIVNIGKSVSDSLQVTIKHQHPDGSIDTLFRDKIAYIKFADSISMTVTIDQLRGKGLNRIIVTADPLNEIDEIDESNNSNMREFFIYEDEARPVYPYNYSIIKVPNQKLYASTANPLGGVADFKLEIDTTEKFNSPSKITKTLRSAGGVLEFDPGVTFTDSTVYYWRTAPVPSSPSVEPTWASASFTYIADQEGFNQSHHDQHKQSSTERMRYDSTSREWKFGRSTNNLFVINGIYNTSAINDNDLTVSVNGNNFIRSACVGNSLVFNIFDSVTFKPWKNVGPTNNNLNLYGSANANCAPSRYYNFEFRYTTAADRKKAMDFMDIIPAGAYVVVRSFDAPVTTSYSATWRADTTLYGSNNSLYHKLLAAGFTQIDSLKSRRCWAMIYKKGDNSFSPKYKFSDSIFDRVVLSADVTTPDTLGYITSPKFGPAKSWKTAQWSGASLEDPSTDEPSVEVIGIDQFNNESVLYILDKYTQDVDISGIDASVYPFVRLRMRNADSVKLTPYQLKYWRLLYDPVPEGALAANIFFTTKDSLEVGEKLNFGVAFKNVSPHPFDSIVVKATIVDKNNVVHELDPKKLKPITGGLMDTVKLSIDTENFEGDNVLFVEVNPNNNQPEQHHFNNFLYRSFYARLDKTNPLLDVTFDGVHILNRDIVSAKPHIQIKLKDEAKYLLLNDTALSLVQVKYPDGTLRTFNFDGDTLRFTPASTGENNTATIDFNPAFLSTTDMEGDEYELIVRGKDRSNNRAGDVEYRIAFRIISKPMISNLLNYPNPFSTSTAFVFTVTGTEVPQNIKIQILTVTGKIVREITKQELGPIHIGRNITEFKWDGTDQYGQKLGNGVYLYRVVTTMNGKPMEKYRAQGDDTDKYFTNGYGKMYLMR